MLLLFGLLTSSAYFILLLVLPDSSWITVHMFLEFQVTRLVLYAGYFALGIYAGSRGWFADGKPLPSLPLWGAASTVLAAAYLLVGQPVFFGPAGAADLSPGLLFVFAFIRSFLLLSLLVVLVSFGRLWWNHSSGLDRQLSAASYDIYLIHYWFVVTFQIALLNWGGAPILAKIAMVFAAALGLSFATSRWVLARHSRWFAVVVLVLFGLCLVVRP